MVNPGPLDLIAAKLKPGGEFRLGTDDPTYCRWSMMVMNGRRDFEWLAESARRLPHPPRRLAGDPLRGQGPAQGPRSLVFPLPAGREPAVIPAKAGSMNSEAAKFRATVFMGSGLRRNDGAWRPV